jgi:hypothetical protein
MPRAPRYFNQAIGPSDVPDQILEVGAMSSTRPLRWIEQAEARQVMTEALFRQSPAASWRKLAGDAITQWLPRVRCRVFPRIVPEWPLLQARPALVRRQDRRPAAARDDDGYYC